MVWPTGAAAVQLRELMDASRDVVGRFGLTANQVWLWGQGFQPSMPSFASRYGLDAALNSAVDLVRGLGVLTGIEVVDVEGMTAGYDTDYAAQRECALDSLADGADLFIIHVEATDEAGHAGDVDEKVAALENWDRLILSRPGRRPRQAGPVAHAVAARPRHPAGALRTHTSDPVPYLLVGSSERRRRGRVSYTERGVAESRRSCPATSSWPASCDLIPPSPPPISPPTPTPTTPRTGRPNPSWVTGFSSRNGWGDRDHRGESGSVAEAVVASWPATPLRWRGRRTGAASFGKRSRGDTADLTEQLPRRGFVPLLFISRRRSAGLGGRKPPFVSRRSFPLTRSGPAGRHAPQSRRCDAETQMV